MDSSCESYRYRKENIRQTERTGTGNTEKRDIWAKGSMSSLEGRMHLHRRTWILRARNDEKSCADTGGPTVQQVSCVTNHSDTGHHVSTPSKYEVK